MATPNTTPQNITLSECINNSDSGNSQGCYDLSIDQNSYLTKSAQWDIQNKAIGSMDAPIVVHEGDSDLIDNYSNIIKDDGTCPQNTKCIKKTEWTNLKLLKTFIDNYQEWKGQEEAAIRKEITEYNNRITAVSSKVDSMLASLDRMEAEAGNTAKQQHMLTELSGMLSTYDRKMDVEESERKNTDSRVENLTYISKIVVIAIVLCVVIMLYVKYGSNISLFS